jgi:type VII secretion protein EccE
VARVHSGQIVAGELAVLLLAGAAVGDRPMWWAVATPWAVLLLLAGFGRYHGRWLFGWAAVAASYLIRPRSRSLSARVDQDAIISGYGVTAVLDIDTDTGLLPGDIRLDFPSGTGVSTQVLIATRPAPALRATGTTAATSYRELPPGPAYRRIFVAVRVEPAESTVDMRTRLDEALRRITRDIDRSGLATRRLTSTDLAAALADLSQTTGPIRESWSDLASSGLHQVTVRVPATTRLPPLPATTITVSYTRTDLLLRLAAPTRSALNAALAPIRAQCSPLDGEQFPALLATLPTGRPLSAPPLPTPSTWPHPSRNGDGPFPGRPTPTRWPPGWRSTRGSSAAVPIPPAVAPRSARSGWAGGWSAPTGGSPGGDPAARTIHVPADGIVIGRDRHGARVTARILRPEPTRVFVAGGMKLAQLLAVRALACGARLAIHTDRPADWELFARATGRPGEPVGLQAGQFPPTSAVAPTLYVVDTAAATDPVGTAAWHTTVIVRDELAEADRAALTGADLVILQPLGATQAALAGAALGLGGGAEWLTRIRPDMVSLVSGRTVRWARLTVTGLEEQLIGDVARATTR